MLLSQTVYMNRLGCNVHSIRQSWDGRSDTKIILKAWTKDAELIDAGYAIRILKEEWKSGQKFGWNERLESIEEIRAGLKPAFIILSPSLDGHFGDIDTNSKLYVIDQIVSRSDDEIVAICKKTVKFKDVKNI